MAGLYGNSKKYLDPKGRIAIPSKMRYSLPEGQQAQLYITRGIERCIMGFSFDEWQKFQKKLSRVNADEITKQKIKREFLGKSAEVVFDKQGRITLPAHLIKHAKLDEAEEALIVGTGNVIEIWNPKLFDEEGTPTEETIRKVMSGTSFDEVEEEAN